MTLTMQQAVLVFLLRFGLAAVGVGLIGCGKDSSDSTSSSPDTTPPAVPTVNMAAEITQHNVGSFRVDLIAAEIGATAHWTFTDSVSGNVSGATTMSAPTAISGINLSPLAEGVITFSFYLQDAAGNRSTDSTHTLDKDTIAPSNYSVSSAISEIDATNEANFAFSIDTVADNIGVAFNYRIVDSLDNEISGSGSISSISELVTGINLATLFPSDISLEVNLEDSVGNLGATASLIIPKTSSAGLVNLTGTITFDYVPHNPGTNGLNYAATTANPARGIQVQLLSAADAVLLTTVTNAAGQYSFYVADNTNVRVRVNARLVATGTASGNFSVTDNTQSNALYVMQGSLASSGATDSVRNLHASSGWTGAAYTQTRAAAPFAILNSVYDSIQLVLTSGATISFPNAELRWSVNNTTADGELTDGDISTSFYSPSSGHIYILGAVNNDTDEYDRHIIAHEWCHYFEDNLSRSDSIGGSHSGSSRLDMRVAFSEGFCNAFSAMASADAIYRDSIGNNQASGFSINLEASIAINAGWYNEMSVGSIVYDIFDANADGVDTIAEGFSQIYETLVDPAYVNADAFTSIHLFLSVLKQKFAVDNPSVNDVIDDLVGAQNFVVNDEFGAGETNDAGVAGLLPIYRNIVVGGAATNLCSINTYGTRNKLGNRVLGLFNAPSSRNYAITITRTGGNSPSDPDFQIYRNGELVAQGLSEVHNSESQMVALTADTYVIEIFDYANVSTETGVNVCFNLSIN